MKITDYTQDGKAIIRQSEFGFVSHPEIDQIEVVWFPQFPDLHKRRFFAKSPQEVSTIVLDCIETDNAWLEQLSEEKINTKIDNEIAPVMAQAADEIPPEFEYHELNDRDLASIRQNGSISLGIWN